MSTITIPLLARISLFAVKEPKHVIHLASVTTLWREWATNFSSAIWCRYRDAAPRLNGSANSNNNINTNSSLDEGDSRQQQLANAVPKVLDQTLWRAVCRPIPWLVEAIVSGTGYCGTPELDELRRSMIHYAVSYGNSSVVEILLRLRPECANARDQLGSTPLHYTCEIDRAPITKMLLEFKPPVDVNAEDSEGNTPLHVAATQNRVEQARLLVAAGATVDKQNKDGFTALTIATKRFATGVARVLIESGAQVKKEMLGEMLDVKLVALITEKLGKN